MVKKDSDFCHMGKIICGSEDTANVYKSDPNTDVNTVVVLILVLCN